MLNKEICKKCLKERGWDWTEYKEDEWGVYGYVQCRYMTIQKIKEELKSNCKYYLEQLVQC